MAFKHDLVFTVGIHLKLEDFKWLALDFFFPTLPSLNREQPLDSKWEWMSLWLSYWLPLMNRIWDTATLKGTEWSPFGNEQLIVAACPSFLLWLSVRWLIDWPNVFFFSSLPPWLGEGRVLSRGLKAQWSGSPLRFYHFKKRNGHKRCRVDLERINAHLFNPTTICCEPITTWPPTSVELHLSVPQRHFDFCPFPVSFSISCWAVVVEGCVTACRGGSLLTSITHLLSSSRKSSSPDTVWGSRPVVRHQMLRSTYSCWSPARLQVVEGLWALGGGK